MRRKVEVVGAAVKAAGTKVGEAAAEICRPQSCLSRREQATPGALPAAAGRREGRMQVMDQEAAAPHTAAILRQEGKVLTLAMLAAAFSRTPVDKVAAAGARATPREGKGRATCCRT
jgi:hypothetical protein